MIINVLNYNTGEVYFYDYNGDSGSKAIESWLKEKYNYNIDEIAYMSSEDMKYYIDPNIFLSNIKPINE